MKCSIIIACIALIAGSVVAEDATEPDFAGMDKEALVILAQNQYKRIPSLERRVEELGASLVTARLDAGKAQRAASTAKFENEELLRSVENLRKAVDSLMSISTSARVYIEKNGMLDKWRMWRDSDEGANAVETFMKNGGFSEVAEEKIIAPAQADISPVTSKTLKAGSMEIAIIEVNPGRLLFSSAYHGERYIAINVEVVNKGDEPDEPPQARLIDNRGVVYDPSGGSYSQFQDLNPRTPRVYSLFFDVPRDASYRLELSGHMFTKWKGNTLSDPLDELFRPIFDREKSSSPGGFTPEAQPASQNKGIDGRR